MTGSLAVYDRAQDFLGDFQAWSVDDVLAMETSLVSVVGLGGCVVDGAPGDDELGLGVWDRDDGGAPCRDDLLVHMFQAVCEG